MEMETKFYDEVLKNIESVFTSDEYDTIQLYKGDEEILEIEKLKIILTTSLNQKNNINKNDKESSIDLGQCENLLKEYYNISEKETL